MPPRHHVVITSRGAVFALCAALLCAPSAAFAQASFTGPSGGGLTFAPPPPNSTRPVPPADIPEPPTPVNAPPAVEPAPQPHTAQTSAPLPAPKQAAPREPHTNMPTVPTGKYPLGVAARYSQNGPLIQRVLTWRVFTEKGENGLPALVAEAKDAFPVFPLAPGNYIVHVSSGLASAAQSVKISNEPKKETFVLPVGGLRVQGRVGEHPIPPTRLRFDVYEGSFLQRGALTKGRMKQNDRPPVLRNASGGDVVFLPAGIYYIQSTYGEGNAQIQADVRIEAGRLTDATVHHRAAQVTFRLVNNKGGEAIANTQWSVLTPGGDSIKESIGAFPTVVLSEGEYVAIARSSDRTFQQNFKVESGKDREIEVLAQSENQVTTARQSKQQN
jgi:hypothetical protein